jgi:hypothetical protein
MGRLRTSEFCNHEFNHNHKSYGRRAEIAYWKGPAPRTAFLPGSGSRSPGVDRTVEKQAGLARFAKVSAAHGKGHELNLWIVGDAGGYQVLRFTNWHLQTQHGKAIFAEAVAE